MTTQPKPLLSYSFLYENCANSKVVSYKQEFSSNVVLGILTSEVKSNQFSCGISNGVREGVPLTSDRNVTILKQNLMQSNAQVNYNDLFTIEMWIRPRWNLSSILTVWSIGPEKSLSNDGCGSSMIVSQIPGTRADQAYFALTACANSVSSGQELSSPIIQLEKLSGLVKVIHLVIAVSTNSYSISTGPRSSIKISEIAANFTINGDMGLNSSKYFVYSGSNSMSFRNWRDSDKLMIFPGSVSSGSKLDPYFSEADIAILHYIGIYDTSVPFIKRTPALTPSPLIAYNKTEAVKENGEVGNHYFDPQFYTKPVPVDQLHTICMGLFQFDMHPSSPNYAMSSDDLVKPLVVARNSFPMKGQLYYVNGTPIVIQSNGIIRTAIVPWEPVQNCYALRYRPRWNEYSDFPQQVYDRLDFTYTWNNFTSGLFVIKISIQEVPKPPSAITSFIKTVSRTNTVLSFTRLPYKTRTVDQVFITSLPSYGSLSVLQDNGSTILINEFMLGGSFPIRNITYFYRGPELLLSPSKDIVGYDSFSFGVIDNDGLRSTPTLFLLNVSSAIESAATVVWGAQESPTVLVIKGRDHSDLHRPLYCVVKSFPKYGQLSPDPKFLNHSVQAKQEFVTLSSPSLPYPLLPAFYNLGIPVIYKPSDPYYFNLPTTDQQGRSLNNEPTDNFTTVWALNVTREGLDSTGTGVAQQQLHRIYIRNVNDPTAILYPRTVDMKNVKIYAFGSNTKDDRALSEFVLRNLTLTDPDREVDLVRVVVQTFRGGILQLNNTIPIGIGFSQSLFFFESPYCRRQSNAINSTRTNNDEWYCVGDYFRPQSKFSFVSTVSAAESVLNGAIYRSVTPNIQDTIRISIFDGVGGQCLTQSMHNNEDSIRLGCFETFLEIQIDVGEHLDTTIGETNISKKRSDLMSKLRYAAIGLIVLLVLLLIKWCWTRRRNKQHQNSQEKSDALNETKSKITSSTGTCKSTKHDKTGTDGVPDAMYRTPPRKTLKHTPTPATPSTVASTPGSVRRRSSPRPPSRANNLYERLPTHSPEPQNRGHRRLPEGWTAHRHQSGKVFYYNSRTKKSSWKPPIETFEIKL